MALIFLCTGCCNASTDKFTLSAATTTVDTTTVRTAGSSSWRTNITGTGSFVQHFFASATQELTFRGYLRFTSLPNAAGDRTIWQANSSAGGHATIQVTSAGLIKVLFSGGTAQNHPTTVTTGVWYRVDVKVDVDDGTGTAKLNVQIDGVAATQATIVQTATTITYCRWGAPAASTTMDLYWADVRIDNTIAVYPIGAGFIKPIVPVATGTHSFTTGDFQTSGSVNIATNNTTSWAEIDDMPLGGAAVGDYWKQVVSNSAGYLEYTLTQIDTAENPKGVTLNWAVASSAAAAANLDARLNDGGTISAASHYTVSVTTVKHGTRYFDVRPNGSTEWTLAAVNALRVRAGYSTDLTGYMAGVLAEVEFTTLTVSPGLIAQTATLFAPASVTNDTSPQTVTMTGVIAQTATIYAPSQVKQSVVVGAITQTATVLAFSSIKQTLSPGLITQAGVALAPSQVTQSTTPGVIAQTPAVHAPTFALGAVAVAPSAIASTGVLHAPTFALGSVSVLAGLIAQTATLAAPTVHQAVAVGLITQTAQVYAPSQVKQAVTAGLIAQTAVLHAPSLAYGIVAPAITQTGQVFAPTLSLRFGVGFITQTATLSAPQVNLGLAVGAIAQTAQLYTPTFVVLPGIPLIAATAVLYEPNVVVLFPVQLIEQTVLVYEPTLPTSFTVDLIAQIAQVYAPIAFNVAYAGPPPYILEAQGRPPRVISAQ